MELILNPTVVKDIGHSGCYLSEALDYIFRVYSMRSLTEVISEARFSSRKIATYKYQKWRLIIKGYHGPELECKNLSGEVIGYASTPYIPEELDGFEFAFSHNILRLKNEDISVLIKLLEEELENQ